MSNKTRLQCYLAEPNHCPFCFSTDLDRMIVEAEVHRGEVTIPVGCIACDAEWTERYQLATVLAKSDEEEIILKEEMEKPDISDWLSKLNAFYHAARALSAAWETDEHIKNVDPEGYPHYLPSFDEFAHDVGDWLEAMEGINVEEIAKEHSQ